MYVHFSEFQNYVKIFWSCSFDYPIKLRLLEEIISQHPEISSKEYYTLEVLLTFQNWKCVDHLLYCQIFDWS